MSQVPAGVCGLCSFAYLEWDSERYQGGVLVETGTLHAALCS